MWVKSMAILRYNRNFRFVQLRQLSQLDAKVNDNADSKMQAWQINSYGGIQELQLNKATIPALSNPNDVLVKIDASSVNPIDVAMINGYGSKVLNLMRQAKSCCGKPYSDIEFPLTMGRDFAGTVVSKGHGVDKFKVGDEVWGVIPVEQQGCHSNFVVVNSCLTNLRPQNITYIEAASILYAGLTAWSALYYTGGLCYKTVFPTQSNKQILVLGGSGGVGTLAVQLLKAWRMQVVTTCSTDATDCLYKLGADTVIDYTESDVDAKIIAEGPYDIILDCANVGPEVVKSKKYPHHNYITLNSPLLKNIDEHGLVLGAVKNISHLLKQNIPSDESKSFVKWGFFAPSPAGIKTIQEFVESRKIVPVVQEVFPFRELPEAYKKVQEGHLRGKIVIDMR